MLQKSKIAIVMVVLLAILVSCGIAANGEQGPPGPPGVGINNIINNGDGTFTINLTDGSSYTTDNFTGPQGPQGPAGLGFETVEYAKVNDSEPTNSTTWTDLSTPGPSVTVTITSGKALVILTANIHSDINKLAVMSFAISGNTTDLPSWYECLMLGAISATTENIIQASAMYVRTGLSNGSNTFTAKYMVTGGTGYFAKRSIIVIPLP
jgi:hypothetical protein